ncbi:hypothetical protein [Rhodophyticola sp. CCM32]|uniref:hypothetical protein n=1 Tax=Rhodophyticola sp. CCM32 TaxID=2916397 RepID=UPI00143D8D6D|nr:hypothetical protein [Rhodophyticola sp. CCM32]
MMSVIRSIDIEDQPWTEYQKEQAVFAKMQMELRVWWPKRLYHALRRRLLQSGR